MTKGRWWSIFLATILLGIVLFFPVIVLSFIVVFYDIQEEIANTVSGFIGFLIGPFFGVYGYLLYVRIKEIKEIE